MSGEAGGDDDVVFSVWDEVFDFEAETWAEGGELFVECGCDSGDGDIECAGAFIGGRLSDPDLFGLSRERCGAEGEFEAVQAFFSEGWGLKGFFKQIAELVGDVGGGGEFRQLEEFVG